MRWMMRIAAVAFLFVVSQAGCGARTALRGLSEGGPDGSDDLRTDPPRSDAGWCDVLTGRYAVTPEPACGGSPTTCAIAQTGCEIELVCQGAEGACRGSVSADYVTCSVTVKGVLTTCEGWFTRGGGGEVTCTAMAVSCTATFDPL